MKTKNLHTQTTEDSIETLILAISDGLIQLYSDDDGQDILNMLGDLILQIDSIHSDFEEMVKRGKKAQFCMELSVELYDKKTPHQVQQVKFYVIGSRQRSLNHGYCNGLVAYHEAEIRGMPQYSHIAKAIK